MTFMGLEARKDLPKVTYPTALDYFVFISFMYIFSTVVQVEFRQKVCFAIFSPCSLAWFTTLPSLALENITWKNWKMKFVEKENSEGKGKISENLLLLTLSQRR